MQGHTLDELHQSFWVEHLYISIKKFFVCPRVHVEAGGWYQLFSLVLLCRIFDTGFSLSLELRIQLGYLAITLRDLSLLAPELGLQGHAAASDILCGFWGSGLSSHACPVIY